MPKAYEEIAALNEKLKDDEEKFILGNRSAGTRARKTLQEIKKVCGIARKQIQQSKVDEEAA